MYPLELGAGRLWDSFFPARIFALQCVLLTVERFSVFLAVKHCQDRQAQLQSAQCNNVWSQPPSQSAHSYWSHKNCFERPNTLHQWVWTQIYCSRGNCHIEHGNFIPKMSNRCGQIIGQAAPDQLALWGNPTIPIVSCTTKLKWGSTRTTLSALLLMSFFFPISATVSVSLSRINSSWPANHLQTCHIRANTALPISSPL